jgi:hypothetical protein
MANTRISVKVATQTLRLGRKKVFMGLGLSCIVYSNVCVCVCVCVCVRYRVREIYCSHVGSVIWFTVELSLMNLQHSWPIILLVKFVPEVSCVGLPHS